MSVRPTVISLDTFPLAGQSDAWSDALRAAGLIGLLADGNATTGEVSLLRATDGAALIRLRATPQHLASAGAGPREPLVVTFHFQGSGAIVAGGAAHEIAEGDLCICDRAQPFTLQMRDDFELLLLEIPRERVIGRLGRARANFPAVLGSNVAAVAARALMRTLLLQFETISAADLASAQIGTAELIIGALLGETPSSSDSATKTQAAHFRRVTTAIEVRLGDPELSMAAIASQEALSQRYIQRLFELQETTFSDYLRQRRLDRARLDLADPRYGSDGVAEIAFRWGFRDAAHFSRAFSAAFGMPPRAFRSSIPVDPRNLLRRGRPLDRRSAPNAIIALPSRGDGSEAPDSPAETTAREASTAQRLTIAKDTIHWGYLSRSIPPVMQIESGTEVVIETLTQHAYDDYDRMIKGDPAAESVFAWTRECKAVDRRGAGPMSANILGRGAGEGFGVHIFTGPVYIEGAEPGDVLEVQILDISPRPSANPEFLGRSFASNVSAWWGYQYSDLLTGEKPREIITIYEMEPDGAFAHAVYSYRWTPQIDPFGVRHDTMDYPGIPVDHASVEKRWHTMPNIRVPLRPHFGCMAVAPREAELVDSIPPGYFGGNFDNWRAGKGSTLYLPVAVPGALFSVGDGHLALGDGEVNGTALEASLTGRFRFIVHKRDETRKYYLNGLNVPLLETQEEFVLHGFSYPNYLRDLGRDAQSEVYRKSSLSRALRSAFRSTRKFLMDTWKLSEDDAVSLISVGVDFGVTQVADGNWGVHAVIRKSMFTDHQETD